MLFALSSLAFISYTYLQKVFMPLSIHSLIHSFNQPVSIQTFPKSLFCSRNTLNTRKGCKDELEMVSEHIFIQNQRSRVYYSKIPSRLAQKNYFCTLEIRCHSAVNWSSSTRSCILHFHFQNLPFPSFWKWEQLAIDIFWPRAPFTVIPKV